MPSVEQVAGTLPCAFKEKFTTTFAITDSSEIFIVTPTDLHMQSSTGASTSTTTQPSFWLLVLLMGLFPTFLRFM